MTPRPGLVSRRRFAAFVRSLAPHIGFRIESPDFVSVRDTGHGLHIKRRKRRPIGLILERQYRWATAFFCYRDIIDGTVYTSLSVTTNYENGTITETQDAEGGIHVHTPSDESYVCPAIDVSSDEDEEFDYGAFISTDDPVYSGALDPAGLLPAAAAALENDGAPATAQSWSWYADDAAPTGITQVLGSWTGASDARVIRRINSYQYRWRVTGPHALDLAWDQGGSSFAITVPADGASAWYDDVIPATESVSDQIDNVVIALA